MNTHLLVIGIASAGFSVSFQVPFFRSWDNSSFTVHSHFFHSGLSLPLLGFSVCHFWSVGQLLLTTMSALSTLHLPCVLLGLSVFISSSHFLFWLVLTVLCVGLNGCMLPLDSPLCGILGVTTTPSGGVSSTSERERNGNFLK